MNKPAQLTWPCNDNEPLFKWENLVENYRVIGSRHIDCITPKRGVVEVRIAGSKPGRTVVAILNFSNDTASLTYRGESATFAHATMDVVGIKRALSKAGYPNLPIHGNRLYVIPRTAEQQAADFADEAAYIDYIGALANLNITDAMSYRRTRPSLIDKLLPRRTLKGHE